MRQLLKLDKMYETNLVPERKMKGVSNAGSAFTRKGAQGRWRERVSDAGSRAHGLPRERSPSRLC